MTYELTVPVVVRYRDGRMLKCHANRQFSVAHRTVQLIQDGRVEHVPIEDLKAVFFVRDLEGRGHGDVVVESAASPQAGDLVSVTFYDGETIVGRVLSRQEEAPGFFLFPLDSDSNNERIFIVNGATTSVETTE